jgi:hypothetical protein
LFADIKKPNELKYEWDDDISPQQKDRLIKDDAAALLNIGYLFLGLSCCS